MVGMEEQPRVREIDSVQGLRALADPVRLAILVALDTRVPDGALPVMSVKELAQRLGEPQTKLYSTTGSASRRRSGSVPGGGRHAGDSRRGGGRYTGQRRDRLLPADDVIRGTAQCHGLAARSAQ